MWTTKRGKKDRLKLWQKNLEQVDLEEPTTFLDQVYVGARKEIASQTSKCEGIQRSVRILDLAKYHQTVTWPRKISREYRGHVL